MKGGTHARFVLDASVAAKWFTRHGETDREKAVALRRQHESGGCRLIVPEFSFLEILNAVRYSDRAEEADAVEALLILEQLRLEIAPMDWDLLRKANAVAWTHGIVLYDAAYVALAQRERCPLVTADDVLSKKLSGLGVTLRLRDIVFS